MTREPVDVPPTTSEEPDPGFAPLLQMMNAPDSRPMSEMEPEEAREAFRLLTALAGPVVEGVTVTDRDIDGPAGPIPIRIVTPDSGEHRGVLVWFHGGGFVIGDLDTTDDATRRLAVDAACTVVSVDSRPAP